MVAPATPLVGRDADLSQLVAALAQAGEGAGSLVLVCGEAGIGKTRLCAELSRWRRQRGGRVLLGRAAPQEASGNCGAARTERGGKATSIGWLLGLLSPGRGRVMVYGQACQGPTMQLLMYRPAPARSGADALFASMLQRSDGPCAGQVRKAVAAAMRACGGHGARSGWP